MVFFGKPFFADVLIVSFSRVVRRVEVEKTDRTVILPDQFFKVPVFDHHISKPDVCLLNQWKILANVVRLASKTGKPGCVAVANQLIKSRRLFHVGRGTVTSEFCADTVKFFARVQRIPQFIN